jgi:hypothetical protein
MNKEKRVECSRYLQNETVDGTFFNYFRQILFDYNSKYSGVPTCPYLFANSHLNSLYLNAQTDSFVMRNLWRFEGVPAANDSNSINSTVWQLYVSGYKYSLDERLLDRLVFERLRGI